MSYTEHNFKPKQILTSDVLNEMDEQIAANDSLSSTNASTIGDSTLETTAKTLTGATNELKRGMDETASIANNAVSYSSQTTTEAQKAQARANISAAKVIDSGLSIVIGA